MRRNVALGKYLGHIGQRRRGKEREGESKLELLPRKRRQGEIYS
jgi:hypothetical protein